MQRLMTGGKTGAHLVALMCLLVAGQARAHFGMIIPSDDMVTQGEPRTLTLDIRFWHPFEGLGMNMARPVGFGVFADGRKTSLLDGLKPVKRRDRSGALREAFTAEYPIKRPGDHIFYVEPAPYWEPAEESYIVHYTKVIVNAFGLELGWDAELGLRAEIVPLTRPYGLYAGNVFQGIVKFDGEPAPDTRVEVEYDNRDGALKAEAGPLITQVVKTDANGVFTYAIPRPGWWTFAALRSGVTRLLHEGKPYPVEIGAVLWVKAHNMR